MCRCCRPLRARPAHSRRAHPGGRTPPSAPRPRRRAPRAAHSPRAASALPRGAPRVGLGFSQQARQAAPTGRTRPARRARRSLRVQGRFVGTGCSGRAARELPSIGNRQPGLPAARSSAPPRGWVVQAPEHGSRASCPECTRARPLLSKQAVLAWCASKQAVSINTTFSNLACSRMETGEGGSLPKPCSSRAPSWKRATSTASSGLARAAPRGSRSGPPGLRRRPHTSATCCASPCACSSCAAAAALPAR